MMDDLNFAMITGGGSGICMKIAQRWLFHYLVPSSSSHPLFFSASVLLLTDPIFFNHRTSRSFLVNSILSTRKVKDADRRL